MKKLSALFSLVVLATAFAACSNSSGPEAIDNRIVPLDNGNRWIGGFTVYDSTGAILHIGVDTTGLENGRVIGADRFGLLTDHRVVSNREGGLYVGAKEEASAQWLYLKYPANIGDRVVRSSGADGGRALSVNVISTNESITVPAGTFTTYHYETSETNNAYTVHSYLAPGVGFVRMEMRDRKGDRWNLGSMVWELREVRLAR